MKDRVLPTGTVTFLFSDMEGSTRLAEGLGPAAFTEVLDLHNDLLRAAFAGHGGVERGTQGDSFLVMFRDAPAAVAAAVEAQRAIDAATWPDGATVRVRMGLHTGLGTLGGDDYVGVDVNRAARIAALAHGGQVLLSDASRALVVDGLPAGVTTRALGEHRLRDLGRPERIHQLVVDGLPDTFPALRGGERAAGNLPMPLTSFVGRERELGHAGALLATHRLVTLTGPGGTGKSRLAIELGRASSDRFADGVWFVALDAVRDPTLVPNAITAALALLETPGLTPLERLRAFVADRSMLLVLDNFEHLVDAGPVVADLLGAGRGISVLVTSRAPLRLSMEQEFAVSPLSLPGRGAELDGAPAVGAEAGDADAVRLFVERARRVRPAFDPSPTERGAVDEICRRLDGLPLGIELAAARMGLLGPAAIAERLARALDLPGQGTRDLPERQRTLDATIEWSHHLLETPERRLLAWLSVFAGGARLEEIEAVTGGHPGGAAQDAIEGLSILVEHSLVQATEGPAGPRFRLLETIRMFAGRRLEDSGEADDRRRRHAEAYLALAETAAGHMPAAGQVPWLDLLSTDHDNLRAAMDWAIGMGATEIAHRFVAALWRYWQFRGHMAEGAAITDRVLEMPGADQPTAWRARAIEAAGGLHWWRGDIEGAHVRYAEQVRVARLVGAPQGLADALFNLGHTLFRPTEPDRSGLEALMGEARALYTQTGDERALARLEWTVGYSYMAAGRFEDAGTLARTSLDRFERGGDEFYVALAAAALGGIALAQGDVATAFHLALRSMRSQLSMGDTASLTLALRTVAAGLLVAGMPEPAATALGAYQAASRRYGYRPPWDVESWISGLGGTGIDAPLSGPELAAARERGTTMTFEDVVAMLETFERQWALRSAPSDVRPAG